MKRKIKSFISNLLNSPLNLINFFRLPQSPRNAIYFKLNLSNGSGWLISAHLAWPYWSGRVSPWDPGLSVLGWAIFWTGPVNLARSKFGPSPPINRPGPVRFAFFFNFLKIELLAKGFVAIWSSQRPHGPKYFKK